MDRSNKTSSFKTNKSIFSLTIFITKRKYLCRQKAVDTKLHHKTNYHWKN